MLAYDPVGQGERQQAYDRRMGDRSAAGPTDQHFMAGAQSLLRMRALRATASGTPSARSII